MRALICRGTRDVRIDRLPDPVDLDKDGRVFRATATRRVQP